MMEAGSACPEAREAAAAAADRICPIGARAGSVPPTVGHEEKKEKEEKEEEEAVSKGPSQLPGATITHQDHVLQQNCLDFHP